MYIDNSVDARPYEAFISALNEPAVVLGTSGRIQFTNAHFTTGTGHQFSQLTGHPFRDLLSGGDKTRFDRFVQSYKADPRANCGAVSDANLGDGPDHERPTFICLIETPCKDFRMTVTPVLNKGDLLGFLCQRAPDASREQLKLRYLLDHLEQGIWEYDTRLKRFTVSAGWRRLRGMAPDFDFQSPDYNWLDDIHPDDRDRLQQMFEGQTRGDTNSMNIQYRWRHPDGRWVWVLCSAKVMDVTPQGSPSLIVGTDTDITDIRDSDENIKQLAEQLRLAVDASAIGIWEFDPDTGTVHWDDRMLEMYGLAKGENTRTGGCWEGQLHPDDAEATIAYSDRCQADGSDFSRDYRIVRPDGEVRHIRSRASRVHRSFGTPKLVGANIDITEDMQRTEELEAAKAQLRYDSRHDALTGLANRRLLDETVAAGRDSAEPYAILHLDLDYFKTVNDTFGHAAGDAALVEVANRLRAIVQPDGLIGRVGGDEFAIYLQTATDRAALNQLCDDLVSAMAKPIPYKGHSCQIGVSIGCAIGQGWFACHSEIFMRADAALYAAKNAGRNCYRIDRVPA